MSNRWRLEKREEISVLRITATSIVFAALALVFCGLIILAVGYNPIDVYVKMFSKSFFSLKGLSKMMEASLPLIFCSLGVALTYMMNLNNIGAEGQYAIGVIFGGLYIFYGPGIEGVPGWIMLAVMCFIGGALWCGLCAIPKALWDVNESITTLLLNYIALFILSYLCLGPWKQKGATGGSTERISKGLDLPEFGDLKINLGFFIGIAVALLIFWIYKYTTLGYQLSVMRYNPQAATYAGINIRKYIFLTMLVSGGLAGLGGYVQLAGVSHRIVDGMPNNAGYTAIVIAYLARLNPLVVVIVSLLLGGLQNSTASVQAIGVPSQIATMIQGAIMIFVIAGDFFQKYKIVSNRRK